MQYQWKILQDGCLPLQPDGRVTTEPHQCTATLVWPRGASPSRKNSLVVDPCFTAAGLEQAMTRLADLGASLGDVGSFLETHQHGDHCLRIPRTGSFWNQCRSQLRTVAGWQEYDPTTPLPGLELVPCPGHASDLRALRFQDSEGEVWIASDAVLNRDWLVAWEVYWPNVYGPAEIQQTWRSLARILSTAERIIPGHGPPLVVDRQLLEELIAHFPRDEQSRECPDVLKALFQRANVEKCRTDSGQRR